MPEVNDPTLLAQLNGQQAPQPIVLGTPNPLKRAKDQADLSATLAGLNRENALLPVQLRKANADAALAEIQAKQGATSGKMTAEVRAAAMQAFQDAPALERVAAELEKRYAATFAKTKGVKGILDYLPTNDAKAFNDIGNQARGRIKRALGFTGGEANTATEMGQTYGPFIPQNTDRDEQIVVKIQALRDLARDARNRSIAVLGGVPDANGNIVPTEQKKRDENLPLVSFGGAGGGTGPGNPTIPGGGQPYSTPDDIDLQNRINQGYASGASFEDLNKMSIDAGRGPLPDLYKDAVKSRDMGKPFGAGPPPTSGQAGMLNDVGKSPIGAGILGLLDAGSMGVPSAVAGDAVRAVSDEQPVGFGLGQIGGAVGLTGGMKAIGSNTIGKAMPALLGGGAKGAFARNLVTDTVYGAGYGQNTNNDPLGGAMAGFVGSGLGQVAGGALGSALRGGRNVAAQSLRARGIPLTVGQAIGGIPKRIEDAATSIPGIGDIINARRLEGLKSFNEEALGNVLGTPVTQTGPGGFQQAKDAVSAYYKRGLSGVNAGVDPTLTADLSKASGLKLNLPADLAKKLDDAMALRVNPALAKGSMSGEEYQQAQRGLKSYKAEHTKPGFEEDYRNALSAIQEALKANMMRNGGAAAVDTLAVADPAYQRLKVIENAMSAARNGSQSGEAEIFTPAQLNTASSQSARKYGGNQVSTARPFYDLATDAQAVLPSRMPDSGTAGRLAAMMGGTALIGGGGGAASGYSEGGIAGALNGGSEGFMKGLLLGATVAGGGSRPGQKLLVKALLDRPDVLRRAGNKVVKRAGIFGGAGIPLFLDGTAP